MGWVQNVNAKVATSVVGKWFRLDGSGHVSFSLFFFSIALLVLLGYVLGNSWCSCVQFRPRMQLAGCGVKP